MKTRSSVCLTLVTITIILLISPTVLGTIVKIRYPDDGRYASALIDQDGDGKYEYVMETDVWNVFSSSGYLEMTWNYSTADLFVDINLANIVQENPSSWVHAYPEIWYGAKPWNNLGPADDGSFTLPKKLSELNDFYVTVDYNITRVDPNLPFNFCFETWLTRDTTRNRNARSDEVEIMIWFSYYGMQGAGSMIDTITQTIQVNDTSKSVIFEIWRSNAMPWEYFAFRPTTTIDKGKVRFNWAPFIQKARSLSNRADWQDLYFTVVELGTEFGTPTYLQAQLRWAVYELKFEYTNTPILTPPPGVGGIVVPIDKFGMLIFYIGLASTVIVVAVAIAVYVKRRKEKQ